MSQFSVKMPNINYEIKLDFKDVMLRPKRSTLKSRSDVSIDFAFWAISKWNVPIFHIWGLAGASVSRFGWKSWPCLASGVP